MKPKNGRRAAGDLREQIHAEQVGILFENAPLAQAVNLVVASFCAWTLWSIAPHETILGWWWSVAGVVVFRIGLIVSYRRRSANSRVAWHTWMTMAAACSGIVWGTAGLLFFIPDAPIALILITVCQAGMSAGAIASHTAWLPSAVAYIVPTMLPITVRYMFEGGNFWVLGIVSLVYFVTMLAFAHRLSRTLIESIRLRLEKQELAQQLSDEMSAAQLARGSAEDASRAKSRFLAAASHDLRQPLHAMNLFIEVLSSERDPDRAGVILANLKASSCALEDLLNELLDISKLEAGLFRPQVKAVAVQNLFEVIERELHALADEKGIELRFHPSSAWVATDAGMMLRILRNIITNAIRYTEHGAVLVGCRRKGNRLALAVYDTGPGIAPEFHQAIFREFYQLGNPERDRRKGLGLGLAIVDGLSRVLDHPLELKSRIGHGTMLSVAVPRADLVPEPASAVADVPPRNLAGKAVLVIDDEPAICLGMQDLLGRWGCRVLSGESEEDALARMREEHFTPDAILADYRLREGRTGIEAIRNIRKALGRDLPAAILTGDTSPERLREADASNFMLIHKPTQPDRVQAVLAELLCQEAAAAETA